MKKVIQIIWVSILSVVILITTSGFYTFQHQCNHMNKVTNSVLLEVDCCNQLSFGHLFHNHSNELVIDKESCCKTDRAFNKLISPFEQTNFKQLKIVEKDLLKNFVIEYSNTEFNLDSNCTYNYPINGPPLVGKQILYFTQQLKLSPPVC